MAAADDWLPPTANDPADSRTGRSGDILDVRSAGCLLAASAPIPAEHNEPAASGGSTPTLLLALFLVVLAFFIVMVSYSTINGGRSDQVIRSLASAFHGLRAADTLPHPAGSEEGDVVALRRLESDLGALFATRVGFAEIEITAVGRLLEMTVPLDVLFHRDSVRLREARLPVLDAIVTGVSKRLAGLPYTVTLRVAASDADPRLSESTAPESLILRQAGAAARAMVTRGLPAPDVAIAVERAAPRARLRDGAAIHTIVFVIRITHDVVPRAEAHNGTPRAQADVMGRT
ncbi:MAG: hypothetical protein IPM60_11810 [Rhodospirillales bacterium]|nr:hypothetical protein [Rhodospirillales bacterium]